MAVLYISEFSDLGPTVGGLAPVPSQPSLADNTLVIGTVVSGPSMGFKSATRFVRLHSDATCSILFGAAPTATTSNARMAANQTEYHAVPRGAAWQVSVITNS